MEFVHKPIMLSQCLDALKINPAGIYVDGTVGGAGHSKEIAKCLDYKAGGRLLCLDRDPDAVKTATERLSQYPQASVHHTNYSQIVSVLDSLNINGIDGMLLDLGVSSFQLDCAERGFSFRNDAPLDMRMSKTGLSAKEVVNTYSEQMLSQIIFTYSEEKFARRIASAIVREREIKPIETTFELAEIIKGAMPAAARREKNPCKRTFQAIRIEVNGELDHLKIALDDIFSRMNSGARLAIITFHSLEDRIVKQKYKEWCQGCTCPKDFPVCVCGKKPKGKMTPSKAIEADETEREENPRSKSARLRVFEKF